MATNGLDIIVVPGPSGLVEHVVGDGGVPQQEDGEVALPTDHVRTQLILSLDFLMSGRGSVLEYFFAR